MIKDRYQVKVKDRGVIYIARAAGKSASHESSISEAVKKLAAMLWGEGKHGLELMARDADGTTHWTICRVEQPS